jgi:hypothetical protein
MHPLGYIDAPHPALPLEDIRSSLLTGAYRIRELAFSYIFRIGKALPAHLCASLYKRVGNVAGAV